MIALKSIMILAIMLSQCMLGTQAQNETFAFVDHIKDSRGHFNYSIVSAALLNQVIYNPNE